jgi:regulator of protease activity HflC (stomatin/prohibitin superfamily)
MMQQNNQHIQNVVLPEPNQNYSFLEIIILFVCYVILIALFPIMFPVLLYQIYAFQKGVHFRFGRFIGIRNAGLGIRLPFIDIIYKVDMRITVLDLQPQECISKDTVSLTINAVVFYKVLRAGISNYDFGIRNVGGTSVRQVIGEYRFEELLSHSIEIKERLRNIISERTKSWGVQITALELKNINFPQAIVVSMAAQAAAEREKRAQIVTADGEKLASQKLKDAADILAGNSQSMQIRTLQTLQKIATEKRNTIIFPIPIDL